MDSSRGCLLFLLPVTCFLHSTTLETCEKNSQPIQCKLGLKVMCGLICRGGYEISREYLLFSPTQQQGSRQVISLVFSWEYRCISISGLQWGCGGLGFQLVEGGGLRLPHLWWILGFSSCSLRTLTRPVRLGAEAQGHLVQQLSSTYFVFIHFILTSPYCCLAGLVIAFKIFFLLFLSNILSCFL